MLNEEKYTKEALRKESKRIRNAIAGDIRHQANENICDLLANWEVLHQSNVIATYLPMRSEVDLTPLLSQFPLKIWGIPRIHTRGRMTFHVYTPEKLVAHAFGMQEPHPACARIAPRDIQLVLVPGLVFDRRGWRLGYGGGFYDRFLQQTPGIVVGITYQALVWPEIPHQDHDVAMQFLVTEGGIRPVGKRQVG
jgi:5-formyltetrahydrofolate cyclo-ligase